MAIQVNARKSWMPSKNTIRDWIAGYVFAAPFIIGFFVFTAFPMVYSIYLAFQKWDLISPPTFFGLGNFTKMLSDPIANLSLYNSAYYTIFAVPIQLVISFTLALALTQNLKFRDLYRAGFYLPLIVPLIASAVVWQRIFSPDYGILNMAIGWFGIPPQKWLYDTNLVIPSFIFMSFWMIGRQMVIFIAGLGNIPESLNEAASLDGAGRLRKLFNITIPLMSPLIFYNMVIAIINSFQSFIPSMVMYPGDNMGGPENSALFVVLNIYRQGFKQFNMGYAAALSWELFVIVIGFTIAQFYLSNKWVYYES